MVNCYCMAICMYVVALVNRISFDEGEEMNKVIDAIKQSFTIVSVPFAAEIHLMATLLRCVAFTRNTEFFL